MVFLTLSACNEEPPASEPQPQPGPQAQPAEDAATTPARTVGWSATLTTVDSAFGGLGVTIRPRGSDAFVPLIQGGAIPTGATVHTDTLSRAVLTLSEGGTVTLNHSTSLTLDAEAERSARVLTGQAVFDLPPAPDRPHARIDTPQGQLTLLGTKLSVVATEKQSLATVTQGIVQAQTQGHEPHHALPGQEVVMLNEAPVSVQHTGALGEAFGWSELGESAVSIQRGLGQLFAQTPGGGTPKPLEVKKRKVRVRIAGLMAYTEITETFHNGSGQTLEGVYRFPLPEDAQISRLRLLVDGEWQEGVFVENKRAERIWKQVIHEWRDPAWLKWQHGNQFELRIFPINPNSSRTVTIGYTQRLHPVTGGRRYVYPMPVDRSGEQRVGELDFEATLLGHNPQLPVLVEGYLTTVTSDAEQARVSMQAKDFTAAGDLAIRFPIEGGEAAMRTSAYREAKAKDGFAVFALRPDIAKAQAEVRPRDLVIIADTSYNRQGKTAEIQQKLVTRLIAELDPLDRVAVLGCAELCQPFDQGQLTLPSAERAAQAAAWLETRSPQGGTNLLEAIRVAAALLQARPADDKSRDARIIFLTDGMASSGPLDPAQLGESARAVLAPVEGRLTLVDLGAGSDNLVLAALAQAGSGSVLRLEPGSALGAQALNILGRQYGATLSNIKLELPQGVTQVYPQTIPPLAAGDELVVLARVGGKNLSGDIDLSGTLAGKPWSQRYPVLLEVTDDAGGKFIPRLWAERRIRDLELQGGNEKEIVQLSQKYGLVSRHTSLMALESEAMRKEFGLSRNNADLWTGDEEVLEQTLGDADSDLSMLAGEVDGMDNLKGAGGGDGFGLNGSDIGSAGTMGSGSIGKSSGGSLKAKKSVSKPRIKPANPQITGSLDKRIIRKVIMQNRARMKHCYEKELNKDPSIKGKVMIGFIIDASGQVQSAQVLQNSSNNSRLGQCVAATFKRMRFPAPKDGGIVKVRYPLVFDHNGSGSSTRWKPQPRPRKKKSSIKAFDEAPKFDKSIEKLRTQLEKEPLNPKYRKQLIRMLSRAQKIDDAWKEVESWLEKNPMDPEALLLAAEISARRGQLFDAERFLQNAVDALPRATWLQERLHRAYLATARPAQACYQAISLDATQKKPKRDLEPLDCPIASDLTWLQGKDPRAGLFGQHAGIVGTSSKSSLRVHVTWTGDADLDIAVLEPSGRVRSWFASHDKITHHDVRSSQGSEQLMYRSPRDGNYVIELIRFDDGSAPVNAKVEISHKGVSETFEVTMATRTLPVAKATLR